MLELFVCFFFRGTSLDTFMFVKRCCQTFLPNVLFFCNFSPTQLCIPEETWSFFVVVVVVVVAVVVGDEFLFSTSFDGCCVTRKLLILFYDRS